jgi:phosphoribosylaminoimidazole-succinocarboxamide synthase
VPALLQTALKGFPPPKVGKVREIYDLGNEVLIVSTDRISAFDVVMANGIPDKGRVLNGMSAFWFQRLSSICPHHVLTVHDREIAERIGEDLPELKGRATIARKAQPLAIECVARGYISGSLYKDYLAEGGGVHGLALPEGLQLSDKLPEPIFTPATKAEEGHDENITMERAEQMVGAETARLVRDHTLSLYNAAAAHAESVGLILADTKFEFGMTSDGVIWIDEALTPDSSRYWVAAKHAPGKNQPSFDKQFVRDYLESTHWHKQPPGPELPPEVVNKTREKYLEAYRLVTGESLDF